MSVRELWSLIAWDLRVNRGTSWDALRARLLLIEFRLEQLVYRRAALGGGAAGRALWFIFRGAGSIFQWLLCSSNLPGTITLGRGLRLPHPQNIIITGFASIGEFCTIYQNATIAWNGFNGSIRPEASPQIGARVLVGTGAVLIGAITVGSDVLIGAGAVVSRSVPAHARVTAAPAAIALRQPVAGAAEAGGAQHLSDPYSIWRGGDGRDAGRPAGGAPL